MIGSFSRRCFLTGTCSSVLLASLAGLIPVPLLAREQSADEEAKIKQLLSGRKPLKWIFTGDSITQGAKHTDGYRSYQEVFAERVRWEIKRPRDFVINTAVSGHTSKLILDDFNWRITQFQPDVVSMMIGTNDPANPQISPDQFEQNLDDLLNKIRNTGAVPILHTPNPILSEQALARKNLPLYVEKIRMIAQTKNVILVDHYEFWKSKGFEVYRDWLKDTLHPNPQGHLEMARLKGVRFPL